VVGASTAQQDGVYIRTAFLFKPNVVVTTVLFLLGRNLLVTYYRTVMIPFMPRARCGVQWYGY
jgi:hypothetical protein